MKCNKDCLNCKLPACIHDLEDVEEYISDRQRRHKAKYYLQHQAERLAKQREYDKTHRTAEYLHEYYVRNKAKINQRNKERYARDREVRLANAKAYYWEHRDEISARRKQKRDQAKIAGGEPIRAKEDN